MDRYRGFNETRSNGTIFLLENQGWRGSCVGRKKYIHRMLCMIALDKGCIKRKTKENVSAKCRRNIQKNIVIESNFDKIDGKNRKRKV